MEEKILEDLQQIKKELQDIHGIVEQKVVYKQRLEIVDIPKPSFMRSIKNNIGFFNLTIWGVTGIVLLLEFFSD